MTKMIEEILKLSIKERLDLLEAILKSIPASETHAEEIDEHTKRLLIARLEDARMNPDDEAPANEVLTRLKKKYAIRAGR